MAHTFRTDILTHRPSQADRKEPTQNLQLFLIDEARVYNFSKLKGDFNNFTQASVFFLGNTILYVKKRSIKLL